MGKGRKLLPAKGKNMEQESHDMFEDDDETQVSSNDEEDDVHEEEQDSQVLENSQEPFEQTQEDELPSLTSPNEGPRAKRLRTEHRRYAPLTPEEERQLVEFYQANELLYNKKLSAYRDKQRKNKVWEDQALIMGKSAEYLEKWVVGMRTRFAKLIYGKRSGMASKQLTERDAWICSEFAFLRPHIVRCPTRTSKVRKVFGNVF